MARFDAYTATFRGDHEGIIGLLFKSRGEGDEQFGRGGYHGFGQKWGMRREDGSERFSCSWGGRNEGYVMVEAKGDSTPDVVALLRETVPTHRVTRVDSAEDFEAPGAWEKLLGVVLHVKHANKLYGERRGDWDIPEEGRTQYLGANASACRGRLYEKGKEPGYRHLNRPDLVRLEVQVRPKSLEQRRAYAEVEPLGVWGASKFTRELAALAMGAQVAPLAAGTLRKQSAFDGRMHWMLTQYGPTYLEGLELHEGSIVDWHADIMERLHALKRSRRR